MYALNQNRVYLPQGQTFWEEQCLYDHWLERVKLESPAQLLDRFQTLWSNGTAYPDHPIWQALQAIVQSPTVQDDFKFILNRSCYILINNWLPQPRCHWAIPALVAVLDSPPLQSTPITQRLGELIRSFKQTDQYAALQRLAQVVDTPRSIGSPKITATGDRPLMTLLHRYPCLYESNLITEDSTYEQRLKIRQVRQQVQHQFDRDLAQYVTYRRLEWEAPAAEWEGRSVKNPTLLSNKQLDRALDEFGNQETGNRVRRTRSYRHLAQQFSSYSAETPSYAAFKQDLYAYLIASIDSKYGRHQFNQRLANSLQNLTPDYDAEPLSDRLLLNTCRKLLTLLTIDSAHPSDHLLFVDLLGNVGVAATIGLLLKIVLICRKVKPHLEKQMATLFRHYETASNEGMLWLIESFEHLNVAFSLNFSALSL